MRWFFF